ncbi:rapid alkalinization factor-like [Bidens hawaiensis]|uniref:rapid alkalinization factor-like n=1 Tax=Bidens hawaiensis TaxID=980011 RepID=UPI004049E2E2
MPISTNLFLLHLVISAFMLTLPAAAASDHVDEFSWVPTQGIGRCKGSIAECMADGEVEMESESTRRILATSNYISYGALQGNNVPCSQRGASYYNCQSGGQANPYQRGCSTITRCQR